MIKLYLVFLLLSLGFGFLIQTVRTMNGKEKWALTKLIAYSIICAVLAIVSMMVIVILF